ncbi:glycosyltransferase family 4 protein [Rhodocaloribacter litoris]|uniref:glycosyltransferase family 4 protein n=1 Tax=Rhodocaloribacter litoris TaxID=2558931 RepID=UPI00141EF146|nr:glycosyltransferase family 4 protein [Rhodocaloribacter litoris]QXD14289.1 glycosyltransferase family 4 protein [Rhodocaloribacter litoris]
MHLPGHTPPRVVHLTTVHPLRDPRIFDREARTLKEAGFDVRVVAPHTRPEVVEGMPVTALPVARGRNRRLGVLGRAFRAARALQADLYHFHDPELIPIARALKQATGARIVYDMHEDYGGRGGLEGRTLRALERWCFHWVDHVVLASDSLLPVVADAQVPHTLILNYFRPPATRPPLPKPPPKKSFELLYAGTQGRARGLDVLLDIAKITRDEGTSWRLTLAGVCRVSRDRAAAEARIRSERLAGIIRLAGWESYLPWNEMEPYYHEAHAGLALLQPEPNYVETLPTKFYEYLYYGLPILCSDFPRWRAFIEAHGCGAVVDPRDAAAAVRILRTWFDEPETYARLSAAAAEAARHYLWDRMAGRLVALYERLLNTPTR